MDKKENVRSSQRVFDILLTVVFLLFIFGFGTAIFLLKDKTYSEQENRSLQQMPRLSSSHEGTLFERLAEGKALDRLINGSFTSDIGKYYSDQFPARNMFVGIKAATEMLMLKLENNEIMLGTKGYLIDRDDYKNEDNLRSNLNALSAFAKVMQEKDIPLYFSVAGNGVDVLEKYYPAYYKNNRTAKLQQIFRSSGLDYIELIDPLRHYANMGEYVYYKTDHHWTTLGAYYAYQELAWSMGITPAPLNSFTAEIVSKEFYGTSWSSSGMKWVSPDTMTYFRYPGDTTDYVTEVVDTGAKFDGFYDYSYLEKKDKYSSFISSNNAYVRVYRTDGEQREKLLVIKDSFAHSLVPFLAQHYDLEIIDMRYYKGSALKLVNELGIDRVLALYGVDTLCDGKSLVMLNIGLSQQ